MPPEGVFDIAISQVNIPPGKTLKRTLYLQRFITQPRVGSYKIPYSIRLPLSMPREGEPVFDSFQSGLVRGELLIVIKTGFEVALNQDLG
jgi:hypothetical protein